MNQATVITNETVEDCLEQGNKLRQEGKLDEAIAVYQHGIELDPNSYQSYHYLGETLAQKNDLEAAANFYNLALEINPDFFWSYHCLGLVLFWQGKLDEAITSARKAIKLNENQPAFYCQLGQALAQKEELDEAISCYRKAIELNPQDYSPYSNLGNLLAKRENWQEAISAYSSALEIQPDILSIQRQLEYALQQHNLLSAEKAIGFPTNNTTQVFTSRKCLEKLYSSSVKLIVSSIDSEILNDLQPIVEVDVYVFRYNKSLSYGVIFPLDEKIDELVEMQLAPSFCLGFLGFSEQGRTELEFLITWWREKFRQDKIPIVVELSSSEATTALKAEFWQKMFLRAVEETGSIAKRISNLQRQFYELRSLHENVQNAFATVEDFLSQAKLPPIQMAFENLPSQNSFISSSLDNSFVLRQLLPVPSRGLAAIDLHIDKQYSHASGELFVGIQIPEDRTYLAKWQVPYDHLSEDWLRLDLPNIDIGPKREAEIIIEWNTKIGPAPRLSLGTAQPIPEYQAYADKDSLKRSLAFRLWNGLPGTRRVISPYSVTNAFGTSTNKVTNLGYLGQRAMSRVIEITPNLSTEDFPYIRVIDDGAKIMTHPRENQLTIAMLPFCFPPGANYLRATVATEHPQADKIEYAMALIEEGTDAATCFEQNEPESALAFSEWIPVEADSPHQLSLSLLTPAETHYHIAIATRLAPGSSVDHGWARWLNFFIDARPSEENFPTSEVL